MPISQDRFFSIRRPLSNDSVSDIQRVTEQLGTDAMFEKEHDELGLTLVEKTFVSRYLHHRHLRNYQSRHQHVFEPVIPSTLDAVELQVKDVRLLGRNLGRLSLAYILDDPDNVLQSEHQTYSDRIHKERGIGMHGFIPHVSIGKIPQEHATSAVMSAALDHMPDTITLRPVTSDHFYYLPRDMQRANSQYDATLTSAPLSPPNAQQRVRSDKVETRPSFSPRRTLAHPMAFLNSLQKDRRADTNLLQ